MATDLAAERPATADEPTAEYPVVVAELAADDEFVEEELLVEEISIDGMCGVY